MTPKEVLVVELPITDEQAVHMYFEHYAPAIEAGKGRGEATSSAIRSVGVRVESSAPVVGYACPRDFDPERKLDGASISFKKFHDWFPLIRESDHLASLAEKEAEVERLRAFLTPFSDAADMFDADGNEYERDYPDNFDLASGEDGGETTIGMTVGDLRKARSALKGSAS